MPVGLETDLLKTSLMLGCLCFLIARMDLPWGPAMGVAFIRMAIPFVYFAYLNDGTWTSKDDITYLHMTQEFVTRGYTPWSIFTNIEGIPLMMSMANGAHFLYYWWNFFAQYEFGNHYYSPVFLNVLATFLAGAFLFRLFKEMGYGETYRKAFLIFFLLHWDVIAWSSFMNLKDILMMTLTVTSFYLLVSMQNFFSLKKAFFLALNMLLFSWLRFYVPFMVLGIFGLWAFFGMKGRNKYFLMAVVMVAAYFLFPWKPDQLKYFQPEVLALGLVRFPLTPQPWSIDEKYTFLIIPSIMHWTLFLPSVLAGYQLWKGARTNALLLLYLLSVIILYSIIPEVQGPRHRVQITFIFAWLQFHALWNVINHFAVDRAKKTVGVFA